MNPSSKPTSPDAQPPAEASAETSRASERTASEVQDLRTQLERAEASSDPAAKEVLTLLRQEVDRWADLLQSRGETVIDEANLQAHLGLMEVADRATAAEDLLHQAMLAARKQLDSTHEAFDVARLKAHLAKLDVQDEVQARTARVSEKLKAAQSVAKHPVVVAEREVTRLVQQWAKLYH